MVVMDLVHMTGHQSLVMGEQGYRHGMLHIDWLCALSCALVVLPGCC